MEYRMYRIVIIAVLQEYAKWNLGKMVCKKGNRNFQECVKWNLGKMVRKKRNRNFQEL